MVIEDILQREEGKTLGLPAPEFVEIGMRLRCIAPLANEIVLPEPPGRSDLHDVLHPSEQATEQVAEQVTGQVTGQAPQLLAYLEQGPLSVREAMQSLGLRHRLTFLSNYLQPAIKACLVEMTQPNSPKSPPQKYRLASLGRRATQDRSKGD